MDPICELKQVTKRYGEHEALRVEEFAVQPGEMLAMIGPSGSGKTTLLNLIGLLEPPSSGTLRLFGQPAPRPWSAGAMRLRRERLAYLFQNFALVDDDTVDANLSIALMAGRHRHDAAAAKAAALERVGLSSAYLRRRVYTLSGGEQQRVAIARILLKPCELVLADEPTGSVDSGNRDSILDILQEMNREGKTLIIVTHDPVVAERCGRVAMLDKGTLVSLRRRSSDPLTN